MVTLKVLVSSRSVMRPHCVHICWPSTTCSSFPQSCSSFFTISMFTTDRPNSESNLTNSLLELCSLWVFPESHCTEHRLPSLSETSASIVMSSQVSILVTAPPQPSERPPRPDTMDEPPWPVMPWPMYPAGTMVPADLPHRLSGCSRFYNYRRWTRGYRWQRCHHYQRGTPQPQQRHGTAVRNARRSSRQWLADHAFDGRAGGTAAVSTSVYGHGE